MNLDRLRRAVSLFALCHTAAAQKQCFFPNGREAENNFPCDPDAADSPCCGAGLGTACLDNKLCRGPDGNIIRGSCTDQNWQSPDCPLFCLSANTGGTDLISCSNVTGSDTSYCCDHQAFCCDSGVARFDVLPSKPQVLANWDPSSSAFVPVRRTSSSTSLSRTSTSTSTSTTLTTISTPSTSSPPAELSPQSQSPQSTLSVGAQAGIGVGVAIAVIAVAALAFFLFRRRKKNRALQGEREKEAQNSQGSGAVQELPVATGYYGGREYKADGGTWYPSPEYGLPQQPVELGAVSQTHELDAGAVRCKVQGPVNQGNVGG